MRLEPAQLSKGSKASELPPLPDYRAEDFASTDLPECDIIMKGGVTSGIVYPYAVLEIATKYRFRSLGGTSAGAIAAAFAAAAEYGRLQGRPEAFLTLKQYCDALPSILLSLFQPSPALRPAVETGLMALQAGGVAPIMRKALANAAPLALAGAGLLAIPSGLLQTSLYATFLAGMIGGMIGGGFGVWRSLEKTYITPVLDAVRRLPEEDYGFCTGLTQPDHDQPGLTDWIHRALQHIAFGNPDHDRPLTFGDLAGPDPAQKRIDLQVVTTNLSMRRPHTLPRLGVAAGFMPDRWARLFPQPVMNYLMGEGSRRWKRYDGAQLFPSEEKLPVVIAVRMSLSFPILFTSVPLKIEDLELPSIVNSLGGKPYKRIRTAHFSDGGISSNFPIHMFDAPLPSRPTFAFSLEELLWNAEEVTSRVALPTSASEGMGVQIKELHTIGDFAWQVLNSAKDWQDQLLSEITGQRERTARIFLTKDEGGLNLDMPEHVSHQLMLWGYEAGKRFTSGGFDFDEHRWRRLLVLYKHLEDNLDSIERAWGGGYGTWYENYQGKVRSYRRLTLADRAQIATDMEKLVEARMRMKEEQIARRDEKLPRRAGMLKVAPRY